MRRYVDLRVLIIAALPIWGGAVRAGDTQVYKTVDSQGNVVYTDRGSVASAKKTAVSVHEPSADDRARAEQRRQAADAAETQRLQQSLTEKSKQAEQQQQKNEKQARCTSARNRFYSLRDASRLFQHDEQGNRVYLPDEQAEARRTEARKAMEAACAD